MHAAISCVRKYARTKVAHILTRILGCARQLPVAEEEREGKTREMREKLIELAIGYLSLKGAAGATLIQMKAAKLFKPLVFRAKAQVRSRNL